MSKVRGKWFVYTMLRSTGEYSLEGVFDTEEEAQLFIDENNHRYQTFTSPDYHPPIEEGIESVVNQYIELRIHQEMGSYGEPCKVWAWLNGKDTEGREAFIKQVDNEIESRLEKWRTMFENNPSQGALSLPVTWNW